MKWSQFNCLFYNSEMGYFLHNTRSLVFLKLDKETYELCKQIEVEPQRAVNLLDDEDIDYFKKNKILVEEKEDKNYITELKYLNRLYSFNQKLLSLVIAPTLKCNFACPYCYEKDLPNDIISEEVQDKLIDFINSYESKCDSLSISWHGGEPLMAFKAIQSIINKINKYSKLPLISHRMVSNGYLLTEQMCNFFNESKLEYIQITIDGQKDTHDKSRILKNGQSTYDKILKNIDLLTEVMPNCKIGVRTNIGTHNQKEFAIIKKEFDERWKNKKLFVYPAFILPSPKPCHSNLCSLDLNTEQKNNFYVNLSDEIGSSNIEFYPSLKKGLCSATFEKTLIIDPRGQIFKCWADIGMPERVIGNIEKGITNYTIMANYMIGTDKFADEKCLKCKFLPICTGGCNLYRMEYLENNVAYDICPIDDDGFVKYMKLFYKEHLNKVNS